MASGPDLGLVARFVLVGGACFVIDSLVLLLLTQFLGLGTGLAGAVSFSVSTLLNYLLSAGFVYRSDGSAARIGPFVAGALAGLILNELVLCSGTFFLGDGPAQLLLLKILATGVVMVWNFFTRLFIFNANGKPGSD